MSGKCRSHNEEGIYKVYLVPEEGVNVALRSEGATIFKCNSDSETDASALAGDFKNRDAHSSHTIENDTEGLVIKLHHPYLLNRIKMLLWDMDERSYSYYVEVSLNCVDWIRVCDNTKYFCRSLQHIAFPQMVARWIKIVGTHNTQNHVMHVVFVNAYLSRDEIQLDRKWGPINMIVPKKNIATLDEGAIVIQQSKGKNNLMNGDIDGRGEESYTAHVIGEYPIKIQLSQPYILSSMRLLLWDGDDRSYNYEINVSTDSVNWKTVARRAVQKSWQNINFEPLPVIFVRIMGTHNTANSEFHVVHFECPSSEATGLKKR